MKIRLVKFVIGWLMRNHKYQLREAVVPDGKHLAPELLVRPRKALRGKYPVKER
jgi:hypothetical protein